MMTQSRTALLSVSMLLAPCPVSAQLAIESKLVPPQQAGTMAFDGQHVVVTAGGSVFVYERSATGWQLQQQISIQDVDLPGLENMSRLAAFDTISGRTLIAGASGEVNLGEIGDCCVQGGRLQNSDCIKQVTATVVFEEFGGFWTPVDVIPFPTTMAAQRFSGDTFFASRPAVLSLCTSPPTERAVYRRAGGTWSETQVLAEPAGVDDFAIASFQGDTALARADVTPDDNLDDNYGIFLLRESGGVWTVDSELPLPDGSENNRVGPCSVGQDFLAVGAPGVNGNGQSQDEGAVYLYSRTAFTDEWVFLQRIKPRGLDAVDQFGSQVAVDGDTLLIAAWGDDDGGEDAGAVYVFERAGNEFIEVDKLVPGDADPGDRFGALLGLDGGRAAIFSRFHQGNGAVYMYGCGPDTDGDGLCDDWEQFGVPYLDALGDIQRYVLDVDGDGISDANPDLKDLFVEVDTKDGFSLGQAAIDQVTQAFADAPVPNPAPAADGIRLHIQEDQTGVELADAVVTFNGIPSNYDILRQSWFGTAADQADPDRRARLNARAKAFRYGLIGDSGSYINAQGVPVSIGGIAELPGDDFVCYASSVRNDEELAAIFMHELGHTLGLGHGGGDGTNGKPNYPSIMNYVFAYRNGWNTDFWTLDYCREELPTLNENNLDEGLPGFASTTGFYNDHFLPFSYIQGSNPACAAPEDFGTLQKDYLYLDTMTVADFNGNCVANDTGVVCDLNNLVESTVNGAPNPSPGDTLRGHNDWANLYFRVTDGGGAFRGALPRSPEPSVDVLDVISALPPPTPDCVADITTTNTNPGDPAYGQPDGTADGADLAFYVENWLAQIPAVADLTTTNTNPGDPGFGSPDEAVDGADLAFYIENWLAGCP